MPLQPTVDSLDAVDESLRPAYVESADGKFEFDLSKYGEIVKAPILAKNRELLDFKTKNKPALERAAKLADLKDEELDEFRQWKEGQANGGNNNDQRTALTEAQRKAAEKVKGEYEPKLTEAQKRIEELENSIRTDRVRQGLTALALKESRFRENALEQFLKVHGGSFDVVGGKLVFLEDGEPSITSADEAMRAIFKTEDFWLRANDKGGAGSPPGAGRGGGAAKTITRAQWEKMPPAESSKFFADGGTITD